MNYRHGHSGTRKHSAYSSWLAMKKRCYSKSHVAYDRYGGKGIVVCTRWLGEPGFRNFLEDMGERPSQFHTLDRINNDGNYEPGNCRWSTKSEQAYNRKPKILLSAFGESLTIQKWSERFGVTPNAIHYRIRKGWDIERAVTLRNKPR